MAKQAILTQKPAILTNGKLLTDRPLFGGIQLDKILFDTLCLRN